MVVFMFNTVIYVFLLLGVCILIVVYVFLFFGYSDWGFSVLFPQL